MIDETRYGVISDVHGDPVNVVPAIEKLQVEGIDKLIFNGDICDKQDSLKKSQDYIAQVIGNAGESDLETYVQPGSHETIMAYEPVIEHMENKYPNIFDAKKLDRLDNGDHDILFLPGSDFLAGGEYQLGNNLSTGNYVFDDNNNVYKFDDWKKYPLMFSNSKADRVIHYKNYEDIVDVVEDPERSVVFCHVPRKFKDVEAAVDMAEFGEVEVEFLYNGRKFNKGDVFPLLTAKHLEEKGAPVNIKRENRGNDGLKRLYEELDLNKAVSGHFHESSHNAHDSKGTYVPEEVYVSELFWNSGCLSRGKAGILFVKEDRVKYSNVNI